MGGLPAAAQRMLEAIARDPGTPAPEPALQLKPGTRLVREWNGKVHTVVVTDDGVMFEDRRFSSLSQIAREITGAHWSGPRFFGLKRRTNPAPYRGQAHG